MDKARVSVVIPCRNEAAYISGCIASVLRCVDAAGADADIYVVDGRSDDGTIAVLEKISAEHPNVHIVVNERRLTPYAFNLGIYANNDFDYLLIVGSRHVLSENYISESIQILRDRPEIWCVGGTVRNVFVNDFSRVVAAAMGTSFGMGLGNFRAMTGSGYVDTIGTPCYPAHVFGKVGYFDEDLVRNQDDEFNFRVTKAGGKIWHSNLIDVQYFVRGNFKGLTKQMNQYGYWKVFVNRKHRAVTTMRQLVPPAFVLFLFLVPVSFLVHIYLGLAFTALLSLYCLLCIFTGLITGKTFDEKLRIAAIFPAIHCSYGFGYLKGIVHFLILGRKPAKSASELSR
jgi:glycosyltransferase involved in cell wall biosynthesis